MPTVRVKVKDLMVTSVTIVVVLEKYFVYCCLIMSVGTASLNATAGYIV